MFNVKKGKKRFSITVLGNELSAWMLILPAIFCVYFLVVRPQIMGFYWSFFNMHGYRVEEFVGFENYRRVISDTMFLKTLINTCKYVIFSLLIGYIYPIILAIMLNEMVHVRNALRVMIYLPSILPAVAGIALWYMIYYPDQSGLLNMVLGWFGAEPYGWLQDSKNTILYIVISMTWQGAGGTVIYYFSALQGVNRELYEAAMMDGAGFFRRIRIVTLPHIAGISLLFLVRQIINVFSVMEQPLQMTGGGPNGASTTLGLQVYKYGFESIKPQFAMALGVIMFFILMTVTVFYFYLNKKIESNNE